MGWVAQQPTVVADSEILREVDAGSCVELIAHSADVPICTHGPIRLRIERSVFGATFEGAETIVLPSVSHAFDTNRTLNRWFPP